MSYDILAQAVEALGVTNNSLVQAVNLSQEKVAEVVNISEAANKNAAEALGISEQSLATSALAVQGLENYKYELSDPLKGSNLLGYKFSYLTSAVRTLYDKVAEVVSIKDFGGIGNGVADNYLAYQAACDWASWYVSNNVNCSAVIHTPAGFYRLSNRPVCKVTATTSAQRSIGFTGEGMYNSMLIATPENISGLFKGGSVTNNEVWSFSDMGFVSDLPEDAPTSNGIAIEIDTDQEYQQGGWGDRPLHTVWFKDVFIGGYHATSGFARRGNWSKGIRVYKKWNPKFVNCRVLTRYGKNPNDPRTGGGGQIGIEVEACYSPWFQYVYVHGNWEYGIKLHGVHNASEDYEGGTFDHVNVVNADYGLFWGHSYDVYTPQKRYEPGGNMVSCHFDCYKDGIWIRSHQQITIMTTSVYVVSSAANAGGAALPSGVHFEGAANVKADIQFRGGYYDSDTVCSTAIKISGYSDTLQLPCTFECAGVGVTNNSLKAEKTIDITGASFTRRNQEGPQGTQVKIVDPVNGVFGSITEQFLSGGVWRKRKLIIGSQTGTTTSVTDVIQTNNQDYASVFTSGLGAREVEGRNTLGAFLTASSLRTSWQSNTATQERGKLDVLLQKDGALAQGLQVSYVDGDLNSTLVAQFCIGTSWFTKRVTIGPVDSGGTGKRMLTVPN